MNGMISGGIPILNWNIAGAKYLELGKQTDRDDFRKRLNDTLKRLIDDERPLVVTLQELVRYNADGDEQRAVHVIDVPHQYRYHPLWLIDTHHQSAKGKWNKVRSVGHWPPQAYFAQGNGLLIREDLPSFRVFDLPAIGHHCAITDPCEIVKLESGLYLGDRDSEPRAAIIAHLVLSSVLDGRAARELEWPLDVFVLNLHLTTLNREREGVPKIDEEATKKRLAQLDAVISGIVSPYNSWRKDDYKIRGEHLLPGSESHHRYNPIWVIAGDFNFTPESVEYETMIRSGFIDMMPTHVLGTKASGLGSAPSLTLDYVFAGPRYASIDPGFAQNHIAGNQVVWNGRTKISDHFPLKVSVPVTLPEGKPEQCKTCASTRNRIRSATTASGA